jgi:hypothetical protein
MDAGWGIRLTPVLKLQAGAPYGRVIAANLNYNAAQLILDPTDLVWKLTTTLPAGSYGFKAALNRSWTENYGAGGAPGGGNVSITHDGGQITFRYDHFGHLISAG